MDAGSFFELFKAKTVQLHTTSKSQKDWTELMRPVLWSIGQENGFRVRCEQFSTLVDGKRESAGHGEVNDMDFAYFSRDCENVLRLSSASVLIEHENSHRYFNAESDFSKLCTFDVPLRVFIGYSNPEHYAVREAERLVRFFDQNDLRRLCDGETLIIMGWRQKAPTVRNWRTWTVKGKGAWIAR
jgi:hypothetical protein